MRIFDSRFPYQCKYASGHEGNAPLEGFSPRKTAISLYVFTGKDAHEDLLEKLGKFRKRKSCIYINKLSDINQEELRKIISETIIFLELEYGKN